MHIADRKILFMSTIPVVYTQAKCIQILERNESKYSTKNRPITRIMLKSETFEEGNEDKLLTWVEVMKEIMYGYDSVVKLTDAEKKAIPYMILANQFVSTAFFEGKDKYEELYRINKAMTEWIGTNMNKLSIS